MISHSKHNKRSGKVVRSIDEVDADIAEVKAKLLLQLKACIEVRGLTQNEAGEILGHGQSDLSRLLRGGGTGFTVDRLLKYLILLELDIDIILYSALPRSDRQRGRIEVYGLPDQSMTASPREQ